jgi:RES domain-containing protein
VLLWRIVRKPFLTQALAGIGARKYGGRWNSKGIAVVYTAQSLELAVLEALVHLDIDLLPKDVYQIGFELEDKFIEPIATPLPRNWDSKPPYDSSVQAVGDAWVRSGSSFGLQAPASVLPSRSNVLLNPVHADMRRLHEVERRPLPWPSRVVEFLQGIKKSGTVTSTPRRKK